MSNENNTDDNDDTIEVDDTDYIHGKAIDDNWYLPIDDSMIYSDPLMSSGTLTVGTSTISTVNLQPSNITFSANPMDLSPIEFCGNDDDIYDITIDDVNFQGTRREFKDIMYRAQLERAEREAHPVVMDAFNRYKTALKMAKDDTDSEDDDK